MKSAGTSNASYSYCALFASTNSAVMLEETKPDGDWRSNGTCTHTLYSKIQVHSQLIILNGGIQYSSICTSMTR